MVGTGVGSGAGREHGGDYKGKEDKGKEGDMGRGRGFWDNAEDRKNAMVRENERRERRNNGKQAVRRTRGGGGRRSRHTEEGEKRWMRMRMGHVAYF